MSVAEADPAAASHSKWDLRPGAVRVLVISTIGFTLMFAVWLMFGILGIPIRKEFGLTDVQLSWIIAVAVLNGAIWRLPAGIITDRFGGRMVMTVMLLVTAVPAFLVSTASSYTQLLIYAFLVGLAGNSFSVGIAWVSAWWPQKHQGFALGVFGAGNVGASVTKFIGPALIAAVPAAGLLGGIVPGGWRFVPFLYMIMLVVMAAVTWFMTPHRDLVPGQGRALKEMLAPLKQMRVWRFSLYYVVVFGAYVALAAWLPKYYVDVYDIDIVHAGLYTALFIFPASLLRPVGGWISDKVGARKVMYATFGIMLVTSGILMMPYGYIVIERADGATSEILPWTVGVGLFTLLVFITGCAMGVGKAAVYKHIPEYFPKDVGAVGGLVGSIGALGGFFLPPMFAYATAWSGAPQATFGVLFLVTLIAAVWMHLTVVSMLHKASPQLTNKFEHENDSEIPGEERTGANA
ncbi:MAG: NarK/NasA family nitrate transporter [Actinobacteria bacterium]|nr:NarK/NasA family nitrate transporter [Actinomycetota bacterium]MCO5299228.1 NarK/NasA family nitrate transporter [Candidatus Nanopelagicales bacterium]MCB9429539.1 NarK/NasA family nitrate transporter [Actinomycetota bacterium]HPE13477.1 nitrate/nitrite transporter [Actinomycetota bacterium]HPQ84968.1 nitrate/nitrite transporter [Actinomycetota bacterium]